MNVFLRELKAHRKALVFWCLGMFVLVWASMNKYAALKGGGQSINTVFNKMPKGLQAVLGMSGLDLTKVGGYYGILFIYLVIMAVIHSVLIGAEIISKEERDRTSEFLFVKPRTRIKIITSKLSAAVVNIGIFNIVTLVSSIVFVRAYSKTYSLDKDIILLMSAMFILQLIFFSVGTSIAAITRNPKNPASKATAALLATYILSVIVDINEKLKNLKYLTPFKYFEARSLLQNGKMDTIYLVLSFSIIIVLIGATYFSYRKRDLYI